MRNQWATITLAACFGCAVMVATPCLHGQVASPQKQSPQSPQFHSLPSSAYVRASDGASVTDNKTFEFADVLNDDGSGDIRLLLLKTVHSEHINGHEETTGRIGVQAWTVDEHGTRKKRWQFSTVGNDGNALYSERFFRVDEWGCCDWPQIHWYFSLVSGKKLYVSNSEPLEVTVPEGGPQGARYVAFAYYEHRTPPLLQYGTDTQVKQQFSLLSSRNYYDAPEASITVDAKPEKSLVLPVPINFTILLTYKDGTELRIPVRSDAVRSDEVKLPNGYALRSERVSNE